MATLSVIGQTNQVVCVSIFAGLDMRSEVLLIIDSIDPIFQLRRLFIGLFNRISLLKYLLNFLGLAPNIKCSSSYTVLTTFDADWILEWLALTRFDFPRDFHYNL